MKFDKKVIVIILVFAALSASIGCCLLLNTPAPKRSFSTQELLLNQEDMPPGWDVFYGPEPVDDNRRAIDSGEIGFASAAFPGETSVKQFVFRYNFLQGAQNDYASAIQFPGTTNIEGWSFTSNIADASKVSCYTYINEDIPVCTWYVRYNESVIELNAWIGPGRLSIQEMENLAKVIDQKAAKLLGEDTQP
jgi:hypothetical protein